MIRSNHTTAEPVILLNEIMISSEMIRRLLRLLLDNQSLTQAELIEMVGRTSSSNQLR